MARSGAGEAPLALSGKSFEGVPGLFAQKASQCPVRWAALQSLWLAGHPRVTPLMLDMLPELMDDSDDNCALSSRDEILTYLAARNRPEAVPYLEAIARNHGRYILSPEDAVEALITMDDATAADALAALAPSLPDDSRYRVAKRLTDLRHDKAAEVLCGWIDTYRARRHWRAPYWMMNLLLELRVPRAADLIDQDVVAQFSDSDRLMDLNWSIPDAIKALTGLGRPGADVLARWAQDNHFPLEDRIAVLDALNSLGDKRATTLRDAMPQGRKRWSGWKRSR